MIEWGEARERLRAPIFAPLAAAIERLPTDRWPEHDDLTHAALGLSTSLGKPLRFVPPRERGDEHRPYYEAQIAETGEVPTRARNWHDLFNALAWLSFPRTKAAINAQHAAILAERGVAEAKHRGSERDALTLFDEGGVAVVATDPSLFTLIVDFEWKELFWRRRAALTRAARFVAFGHALFEKALEPHLGIVAKTIFLHVETLPPDDALRAQADRLLAAHFADRVRFASPRLMAPMPVLGVPGWHPGTADESFYDDRDHFRGKR